MEMDIYWIVKCRNQDPVKYFTKYPGRFEQWHVKDMDKNDRNKNADVGTGSIRLQVAFCKRKTFRHEALVCRVRDISRCSY